MSTISIGEKPQSSILKQQLLIDILILTTFFLKQVLCTSQKVQVPAIPSSGITVTASTGQSGPVSTVIPLSKTPFPTSIGTAPASVHSATLTNNRVVQTTPPAPKPTDNGDDSDDDDNLPFCDEL